MSSLFNRVIIDPTQFPEEMRAAPVILIEEAKVPKRPKNSPLKAYNHASEFAKHFEEI
ncbi:hypothetical protein [Mesorhizobium sp. M7A.F.Ca.US.002.01.1.1]|uniref:hypothetical protein n=1 Tax=Mesorhizobium sp. M7A.F.Ca.US.002.01.1.1 TaxID=2496700 RepID=UPI0013E2C755|nr:hypothetical protein [Mesorhizobium sp. M7A.F.Ca.US.002.01.1.1]